MSVMPSAMAWAADLHSRATVPAGERPSVTLPPGYRAVDVGDERILWPPADASLPVLGISPVGDPPGTPGQVLATLLPDWTAMSAWQPSSSGSTLSGWRFETVRGDYARPGPDGNSYVTALVMVLSGAGPARVLWALGNPARTILDGEPLLRVLHDLPVGEASGTAALVVGTWRLSAGYGISQYTFRMDGTFERGTSITTSFGALGNTTSVTEPGHYEVSAGVLELSTATSSSACRARVFDELGYEAETPVRQLGLLPVEPGPEVSYAFVV